MVALHGQPFEKCRDLCETGAGWTCFDSATSGPLPGNEAQKYRDHEFDTRQIHFARRAFLPPAALAFGDKVCQLALPFG
jgi:hypothetical protein